MIFDNIENYQQYKGQKGVYEALCWLSSQTSLPTEKTIINSEVEAYASSNEFFSRPAEEIDFEAHNQYIDIHFIVDGVEGISTADRKTTTPKGEYSSERDIVFLNGEAQTTSWLTKGSFLVCYPTDAHRPGMQKTEPVKIKKIVVKIAVN